MHSILTKVLLPIVLVFWGQALLSQDRVALVIGNSAYEKTSILANPINDAEAISERLAELGFHVQFVSNATAQKMRQALDEFKVLADAADVAMVYFAGHGIELGGENYLIPVDAKMLTEAEAQLETVSLDEIELAVEGAKGLAIIILDACRNNPFVNTIVRKNGARATARGLVPIELSRPGAVIGFSAAPGKIALDGDGAHSPYARAFLDVLSQPGVEIGQFFRRIAKNVYDATGGRQLPTIHSQLPVIEYFLFPTEGNEAEKGSIETPDLTPVAVLGSTSVNLNECDRLAGYEFLPRVEGDVGREFAQIPVFDATNACEAAIRAHPEETYFKILLARVLQKKNKQNPRIHDLLLAAADQYPAFAADRMGVLSEHGLAGRRVDKKLAARRYEQACVGGSAMGCVDHARALFDGMGRPKDRAAALEALKQGCDLGFAVACNRLGVAYDRGKGSNFNPVEAIINYRLACDMNYPVACMNVGSLYRNGIGTRKDLSQALKYYEKACSLERVLACVWVGSIYETELSNFDESAKFYFDALSRGIQYDAIRSQSFKTLQGRKAFQVLLKETGFYNGSIDGVFGGGTRAAIGRLCQC